MSLTFPVLSFANSGKRLLTINGIEYTNDDFKNWWRHWNDKNSLKFPPTPDDFIDFQLMVQQGIEMGYDAQPNYLHKLDVFLQVRAMMALKYDEIDSKAAVSEAELKKYFNENYSPVWFLQILAFDSEAKAQKAYEVMLPFAGQPAGQLVFADLLGGSVEEKADTYDEAKVSVDDFHKNKRDAWLAVVRKLKAGEISKPFLNDDNNKYILVRVINIQPAEEGAFEERRRKMTEYLNKEKRNQLTFKFIENLKKKYNVQINQELLNTIKFDVEYPQEFLDQVVVNIGDFNASVFSIIYNVNKEKKIRKDLSYEQLKDIVLNSIISQTLINKESLSRGYEKHPPLLWTYEFYKQNRLKAEVEAGLMGGLSITEQEIKNFYDLKIADFTIQEKVSFSLLRGDEDVLKKIWVGTLSGGDFTELALKYSLDANIQNQEVVSLSPEIVAELKKLDKGNVSLPFVLGEKYGLLKLFERLPGQTIPLEQVKGQVSEQLKKTKFEVIKVDYLNKLKSRSKIDINQGVWNGLEREFGNGKNE
jgi:hypothetical protein